MDWYAIAMKRPVGASPNSGPGTGLSVASLALFEQGAQSFESVLGDAAQRWGRHLSTAPGSADGGAADLEASHARRTRSRAGTERDDEWRSEPREAHGNDIRSNPVTSATRDPGAVSEDDEPADVPRETIDERSDATADDQGGIAQASPSPEQERTSPAATAADRDVEEPPPAAVTSGFGLGFEGRLTVAAKAFGMPRAASDLPPSNGVDARAPASGARPEDVASSTSPPPRPMVTMGSETRREADVLRSAPIATLSPTAVMTTLGGPSNARGNARTPGEPSSPPALPTPGQTIFARTEAMVEGSSPVSPAAMRPAVPGAAIAAAPRGVAAGPVPAGTDIHQVRAGEAGALPLQPQVSALARDHVAAAGSRLPTVPPRLVTDQISVQIAKAAKQGSDHIDIRLTPQALGRVAVHLEVAQDGWVKATVVADNPQVLDALKAEARVLERALQDAGLKADGGSLSFSLRGDGGQSHAEGFERREAPRFAAANMDQAAAEAETLAVADGVAVSTGRVDICA